MKIFTFLPFQLNLGRYELTRSGRVLALPRIPMEILILLVERQGDMVSRQEISQRLWPESDPADRVDSINTAINRIRGVLGDDPARPKYIQTVIGRGYRFAAALTVESTPGPEPAPVAPPAPEPVAANPSVAAKTPAGRSRNRALRWGGFAAAAVLVLLAVTLFVLHRTHLPVASAVSMTRLTGNLSENSISAAALSPDGRSIAFADADGIEKQEIGEVKIQGLRIPALLETEHLAWSPEGTWLLLSGLGAGSHLRELWRVSVDGAAPVLLKSNARSGSFSPDGAHIVYTPADNSSLWVCDPDGRNDRRVLAGNANETFSAVLWTRDGRSLIAERHTTETGATRGYDAAYIVADAATGQLRTVLKDVRFNHGYLVTERRLLFTRAEPHDDGDSASLWSVTIDPSTGAFTSAPERLQSLTDRRVLALEGARDTGDVIAVLRQGRFGVYVGTLVKPGPRLEDVRRLSLDDSVAYPHAWSPDSRAVLYESSRESDKYHIYIQPLDKHDPDLLAAQAGDQVFPRMSPDRRWVIYASRATGDAPYYLYRLPFHGGPPVALNTDGAQSDFRCPDSGEFCVLRQTEKQRRFVFYTLDPVRGQGAALYTMPWAGSEPPQWDISPDASRLVFNTPGSAQPEIRIVRLDSGRMTRVPVDIDARITAVHWAADGQGVFIGAKTAVLGGLYYADLTGHATLLRKTLGTTYTVPSPDGRMVSFIDQNVDSNVWQVHVAR